MSRSNDTPKTPRSSAALLGREVHYGGWLSAEYGQLVENLYREQAARLIQKWVRANRRKQEKDVSSPKNVHPMLSDKSSRVAAIREPIGNKYQEHAKKIKQGRYLELDYTDPEFIRNLFKALRLNQINLNQMVMAHSIHQAKEWLHDYDYPGEQLQMYAFADVKGPYQPQKEIRYATKEQIAEFQRTLKSEDTHYVTINFTRLAEWRFFVYVALYSAYTPQLKTFLTDYIQHSGLEDRGKQRFQELIDRQKNTDLEEDEKDEIISLIFQSQPDCAKAYPDVLRWYQSSDARYRDRYRDRDREFESAYFLMGGLEVGEANPACILSPNYVKNDPNTPTLAFVLPTLGAEEKLQLAVHGKEAAVPAPVAGLFTTRMIRALDERPDCVVQSQQITEHPAEPQERKNLTSQEKIAVSANMHIASSAEILQAIYQTQYAAYARQARPIEITHPDLSKTEQPHGFFVHDFVLTWHDRLHTWRNGANFKDFLRHERTLLTCKGVCQTKDVVMSKGIWISSDMDLSAGQFLRRARTIGNLLRVSSYLADYFFAFIAKLAIIEHQARDPRAIVFFSGDNDCFLLHLIDMVKHATLWDGFVSEFFPGTSFLDFVTQIDILKLCDANVRRCAKSFQVAFQDTALIKIIQDHKEKPNESIILRCKLRNCPGSEALCNVIDTAGIERFFYWRLNAGLCFDTWFESELMEHPDSAEFYVDSYVDSLNVTQLVLALLVCVSQSQILSIAAYQQLKQQCVPERLSAVLPHKTIHVCRSTAAGSDTESNDESDKMVFDKSHETHNQDDSKCVAQFLQVSKHIDFWKDRTVSNTTLQDIVDCANRPDAPNQSGFFAPSPGATTRAALAECGVKNIRPGEISVQMVRANIQETILLKKNGAPSSKP